jgi:hypothetical protein
MRRSNRYNLASELYSIDMRRGMSTSQDEQFVFLEHYEHGFFHLDVCNKILVFCYSMYI